MTTAFSKYHGTGNDFIILDGRNQKFDLKNAAFIKQMCHRRYGIGADGVMVLQSDKNYDFKMVYFNSDGFEGTMCGNGGRCICSFALSLGIINNKTTFIASDGIHEAILEKEIIHLKMNNVSKITPFDDGLLIDTGSPHFIQITNNPHDVDTEKMGKEIRHQQRFAPKGANINFVSVSENTIQIATFERGVESETLSCGTGSVASAIAFTYNKPNGNYTYNIHAKGGKLSVSLEKEGMLYHNIWLSGPTVKVFDGIIDNDKLTIY
jgi:diaminopimelate epimerase